MALLALNITVTLTDESILPTVNNPLAWVFNEDYTEARYENISIGYTKAASYMPAVVEIKYPSTGISDISAQSAAITGYYTILEQKLPKEPESGLYIILYDNGKAAKVIK